MISAVEKDKVGTWDGSMCKERRAAGGGQEKLNVKQYLSKNQKEVKEKAMLMSGSQFHSRVNEHLFHLWARQDFSRVEV